MSRKIPSNHGEKARVHMKVTNRNEYDVVQTQDKAGSRPVHEASHAASSSANAIYTKGESFASPSLPNPQDEIRGENGIIPKNRPSKEEQWANQVNSMSPYDLEELAKKGSSIEEEDIDEIEKNLKRIKEERADKEEALEKEISHREEKFENLEKIGKGTENHSKKKIVEKLESANLPVTEENIARMANLLELSTVIGNLSDKSFHYMIQNQLEPTIPNLYKASFAGGYGDFAPLSKEAVGQLEGDIKEVVDKSPIVDKELGREMARWLLEHHLPLTEKTLFGLENLRMLKAGYGEEDILNSLIGGLKNGEALEQIDVSYGYEVRAQKAIENIQNIDENQVDSFAHDLEEEQRPVTIQNLFEKSEKEKNNHSSHDTGAGSGIADITARRQLEEIRLKMTLESGVRLLRQGVPIETTELSNLVDQLRAIEDEYYKNLLGNTPNDLMVASEGLNGKEEMLKSLLQSVASLRTAPSYILGSTLNHAKEQTIETLGAEGEKLKNTFASARESYEPLLTTPRKDLGDSLKKAFRNIENLLEELNLPDTEENEKAVRILGYNRMEITEENIDRVKAYDKEVNYMLKNLHPKVAAAFIKEDMNPMNMPISELNQKIQERRDELGADDETYSKFLFKMEKENRITEEEKKSFIGIYRLLNNITKTDGGALGYVINTGQEVTLQNLLTGIRSLNKNVTADVDDNYGGLDKITYKRERINEQIGAAFSSKSSATEQPTSELSTTVPLTATNSTGRSDKETYMSYVLEGLKEEITPAFLQETGDKAEDLLNRPIEELYEEVVNSEKASDADYWTQRRDEYVDLIKNSKEEIKFLSSINEEVTIQNLYHMKDFFKKSVLQQLKEETSHLEEAKKKEADRDIKEVAEHLQGSMDSKENLLKAYEKVTDTVKKHLDVLYEKAEMTSVEFAQLKRIHSSIGFVTNMAKRECYEIPLVVKDEITNVNITVVHNPSQGGRVGIKASLPRMGEVEVQFVAKEGEVKGFFVVDNKLGYEEISRSLEELKEELKGLGIENTYFSVAMDARGISSQRLLPKEQVENAADENRPDTQNLYTIAKTTLIYLKELDMK